MFVHVDSVHDWDSKLVDEDQFKPPIGLCWVAMNEREE